ncbi:MAG: Crp/Fnr family transcriptional regulator [Bacillota bacterium]
MIDKAFLPRFRLFAGLPSDRLDEVAGLLRERDYDRGELVFRQGDPGEAVHFLRQGRIKIFRLEADGRESIVRFFQPAEAFGLVVMLDGQPYPATAEAVAPSRVWSMQVEDFRRLQQDLPSLVGDALGVVASNLRAAQNRAHDLAVHGVHARLTRFLLAEAQRQGRPTQDGWALNLDLSREDLAGLVGSARETVSRALADLRRTGAVQEGPGGTLLLNSSHLQVWLED